MANEAKRRYEEAVSSGQQAPAQAPTFSATDLESISGSFHTVVCLDVMIHYPQVCLLAAVVLSSTIRQLW